MIQLQHPWFLLALILPFFMHYLKRQDLERTCALKWPYFNEMKLYVTKRKQSLNKLHQYLLISSWMFLIIALSNPQWVGEPVNITRQGRDIILAIDISGSMDSQDMVIDNNVVTRLDIVKTVAKKFVSERTNDRFGLILFGTRAYLQTPLTFDRKTVQYMIDDASAGLAGKLTAIGDAIGLSVKRLKDLDSKGKVVVLLTDGSNNSGAVDPLDAVEKAKEHGIKFYTIGLGAESAVVQDFFSSYVVNPSKDLDEKMLQTIAEKTNGVFFRATDNKSLQKAYGDIDKLEPSIRGQDTYRPEKDLYYWPLSLSCLLATLLLMRKVTIFRRKRVMA